MGNPKFEIKELNEYQTRKQEMILAIRSFEEACPDALLFRKEVMDAATQVQPYFWYNGLPVMRD